MLKKNLFFLFILLFFLTGLYSQSQVKSISTTNEADLQDSLDVFVDDLKEKWLSLQNLSGSEYEELFLTLLLEPLSQEKLQPYVLAESLWYISHLQKDTTEKKSKLEETINSFLSDLGTGAIIPQEYSDTVYSMFRYFSNNNIIPSSVPELNIFLATDTLHIPTEEIKSIQMYRGGIALEKIKKLIQADSTFENIDILAVLSNSSLLYALQYSSDMLDFYKMIMDFSKGLPEDSKPLIIKCRDLLNKLEKKSLKLGFVIDEILPEYSATFLTEIQNDEFVLCCLSSQDLQKLVADFEGLDLFSSIYFSRITKDLYSVDNLSFENNGGSL